MLGRKICFLNRQNPAGKLGGALLLVKAENETSKPVCAQAGQTGVRSPSISRSPSSFVTSPWCTPAQGRIKDLRQVQAHSGPQHSGPRRLCCGMIEEPKCGCQKSYGLCHARSKYREPNLNRCQTPVFAAYSRGGKGKSAGSGSSSGVGRWWQSPPLPPNTNRDSPSRTAMLDLVCGLNTAPLCLWP